MILVDSSAWIEFLRDTGSEVCERVDELLATEIATTDPVMMEVFAGARDEDEARHLRALLGRCRSISCTSADYIVAAEVFRATRRAGSIVRNTLDCLIAAVAIRDGIPLLHADRDFGVIARHSALLIA